MVTVPRGKSRVKRGLILIASLAAAAIPTYIFSHEYGWPAALLGLAVAAVVSVFLAIRSLRSEPLELALDVAPRTGFDERQKLIRIRAAAMAGRAAFITGAAVVLLFGLLNTLTAQATEQMPVPSGLLAASGSAAIPTIVYIAVYVIAAWRYSRKG